MIQQWLGWFQRVMSQPIELGIGTKVGCLVFREQSGSECQENQRDHRQLQEALHRHSPPSTSTVSVWRRSTLSGSLAPMTSPGLRTSEQSLRRPSSVYTSWGCSGKAGTQPATDLLLCVHWEQNISFFFFYISPNNDHQWNWSTMCSLSTRSCVWNFKAPDEPALRKALKTEKATNLTLGDTKITISARTCATHTPIWTAWWIPSQSLAPIFVLLSHWHEPYIETYGKLRNGVWVSNF